MPEYFIKKSGKSASRTPLSTVSAPLSPCILDAASPDNEAFANVNGGVGAAVLVGIMLVVGKFGCQ